jgi:hypothetical protein
MQLRFAILSILCGVSLTACDNRTDSQKNLDNLEAQYEADILEIRQNAMREMDQREASGHSAPSATAELRQKARTDSAGADADAIDRMPRNEVLATAINTAGFLCAKVRDTYPVPGGVMVHCTEYRSGQGRAKYRIDTAAMEVTKLD